MTIEGARGAPGLRRVLGFWPVVFYGLGVVIGAGIYVAIGSVIGLAGRSASLSFLLAGISAGLTGLCYAELAGRFPEAAGGVSFVRHGFGSDRLAQATGAAITFTVAVSAAAIAQGAASYLALLLPLPAPLLVTLLVLALTGIACLGPRESVGVAAVTGAIEIGGLIVAAIVGVAIAPAHGIQGLLPADWAGVRGIVAGAFLAFFAFIGFESLANLAEETKDAPRLLPRAILLVIAASAVLYVGVTEAVLWSGRAAENPLIALFEGRSAIAFALIGLIAVANGVLAELIMLGRLFYGMAGKGQLPAALGVVSVRTRAPVRATLVAGAIVLAAALTVPFAHLLAIANALTLGVFLLADLALLRVQRRAPPAAGFAAPRWVPAAAAALSLAFLLFSLLG